MNKNILKATNELKELLVGRMISTFYHRAIPIIVFNKDLRIELRQWDEYAPTKYKRCGTITDLRINVDNDTYYVIVDTAGGETITLLQVHASGFDLRVFDDSLGRRYTIEVSTTENTNTKKYEIVEDISRTVSSMNDTILYRIRALKDFGNVLKGDLGGWIEKEENLSQEGDCWVGNEAKVYGNAKIKDNAIISRFAMACDNVEIKDNALINDGASLYENAKVYGNAIIMGGNIYIDGNAQVYENAIVVGSACIKGNAEIKGNAKILDYATVKDYAKVYGNGSVKNAATVSGWAEVKDCQCICKNLHVEEPDSID